MFVTLYGTRGSVPVSHLEASEFGGNTTCLRVYSEALPQGVALVLDAGSGYVPMSHEMLDEEIEEIRLLFTHWHHDHTQGFCLAPHTFNPAVKLNIWGPIDGEIGPTEVFKNLMRPPYFPVPFEQIEKRFTGHGIQFPVDYALVIHPSYPMLKIPLAQLEEAEKSGQLIWKENSLNFSECLVIRMILTHHPQKTICYRFDEQATGKSFVFLTDHENTETLDEELIKQIENADLLIQDCQYSRAVYDQRTKGFGHGTPDYCAQIATTGHVKKMGFTHHDPTASDSDIRDRLEEMRQSLRQLHQTELAESAFACGDYMKLKI